MLQSGIKKQNLLLMMILMKENFQLIQKLLILKRKMLQKANIPNRLKLKNILTVNLYLMKKKLPSHFIRKKISKIIRKKAILKNITIPMLKLKMMQNLLIFMRKNQQILHTRMDRTLTKVILLLQDIVLNMRTKIIHIQAQKHPKIILQRQLTRKIIHIRRSSIRIRKM